MPLCQARDIYTDYLSFKIMSLSRNRNQQQRAATQPVQTAELRLLNEWKDIRTPELHSNLSDFRRTFNLNWMREQLSKSYERYYNEKRKLEQEGATETEQYRNLEGLTAECESNLRAMTVLLGKLKETLYPVAVKDLEDQKETMQVVLDEQAADLNHHGEYHLTYHINIQRAEVYAKRVVEAENIALGLTPDETLLAMAEKPKTEGPLIHDEKY